MIHLSGCAVAFLVLSCTAAVGRESGGMYTSERLANARRNVERFGWAKRLSARAVAKADRWAKMPDEALWRMIPGQDLPRCIDVTMTYIKGGKVRPGCLVCGEEVFKHGNYPYDPDVWGKPWKLTCPSCGAVFPTNDFGTYYESGIDQRGLFNPEEADRSLLFNSQHPDADDPLHTWGVDDGFGFTDDQGLDHRYIAYYVWQYWRVIYGGVAALAEAYMYTGETAYARKCAIMLDRIADVYPDMDWKLYAERGWYHSDGGSRVGKIEGRIWESGVLRGFAENYDKIITGLADQPELYEFLRKKGEQFQLPTAKGTRELLMRNIDDGILRCGAEAIRSGQIRGNEGMYQSAMAACAIALDTEPGASEMLDWVFAADGGHVPGIIVGGIDRDGVGAEAAPGYALSWGANIGILADMLADYGKYEAHDIYRDFPQFRQTFTAGSRITILDYDTPSIGDTGGTGSIGKAQTQASFITRGYRYLRDPEIALAAWRANGSSAKGLGRRVLDDDPEQIEREIEEIAQGAGGKSGALGPHNMSGYGFLTLEYGAEKAGTGAFLYYGRNAGHGHLDRLNIGIYGFGFDLAPDLGYPEFATSWPKRNEWTDPTLAHNTVLVDEIPQRTDWVGHPAFFKALPGFQCAEIESHGVYPSTREYRRTLALVNVSGALGYALDIFRVAGGHDHVRSFHGPGTELGATGLNLVRQEEGTYAGEDIAFGTSLPRGPRYGYSWLTNVERDSAPPESWTVDWKVPSGYRGARGTDDIHVRLWDFTPVDDVALADGEPPQNKSGNPRWLRYCLAHRAGEDLISTFVSILEPYQDEPLIASAARIEIPDVDLHDGPVALRVELADGAIDNLLYSPTGERVSIGAERSFAGRLGFVRVRDGEVERAGMIAGTHLRFGDFSLEAPRAAHTGTIVRMEKDPRKEARVWVDTDLPADGTLAGAEIAIENDRARNAVYAIEKVERAGDLTVVSFGRTSFVRGYADDNDYDAGYGYNFEEGASFSIPTHLFVQREGGQLVEVRASTHMGVGVPGK